MSDFFLIIYFLICLGATIEGTTRTDSLIGGLVIAALWPFLFGIFLVDYVDKLPAGRRSEKGKVGR